ncbi:right-handed parallel beta-helix repeat-containing protein [Streptomyces lunaelactis]|uniref:right-handed parallel beta-helix repeat-containing protein n=1 Tax=Streptomyces lunaelactis TaxID=1535768 RepID=UPI0015851DE7|nr:right-handed parallel beta-helix repeat-containing protein [Streptomyces lunaelactis]NUJ99771.1 right-handed parallel beta-helix repeat-containing protein [Streptomyces lunaelactis]NUK13961.1 right-handed parallel beta-helix repeat-containing protein [Streptomyces lunaelactis]NUK26934.1 right-handed parallel beta-helix repeat-containing protein [Streptomyces lunaelactis]NUK35682.1 right-handed parallel beta-helix repeat-containing protein [Streptomyces lunaelactis]NUK45210.1 right-handed pa
MTKRQITCLACIAVVMVSGLGAAAPSAGAARHAVNPGDSIQEAVDAAKPGDSIVISPGTYRESVLVTKPGLTLRGWGPRTVIVPAPAAARAANACAAAGNGICVLGTATTDVAGVSIRSLTLSGFKKNAIWASRTDRLSVQQVTAEKNGTWGIAQERSTRGVFRNNTARDNGDAGIFIANTVDREGGATDTGGAVIAGNRLSGNRIGVTVRRVRNLTVRGNDMTANCAGVFVVGDESKPAAGAMTIRNNDIYKNNKFCPGNPRLPFIQGSGIVLTGSEATVVRSNRIADNVGASPLSGGIVLFQSFVGASNTDNVVRDNHVQGNKPADLANRGSGTGNTFLRNRCLASEPAGMC